MHNMYSTKQKNDLFVQDKIINTINPKRKKVYDAQCLSMFASLC